MARTGHWWSARLRFAGLAVLTSLLTASLLVALGGLGQSPGTGLYVIITFGALFFPGGIAVQVVLGQLLIGRLMLGPGAVDPLVAGVALAGVICGAELLSVVARLDTPLRRDPAGVLPRTGMAAAGGAGIFAVVLLVAGLPGPTGLLAVVVAAAACAFMAARLIRSAES